MKKARGKPQVRRARKKRPKKSLSRWHKLPWRTWYGEYLATKDFPREFIHALGKLFLRVSRQYRVGLSCPVWVGRKEGEAGHPAGGRLEDAAQEVLRSTVRGLTNPGFEKRYEEGMNDEGFANYLFTTVDNSCYKTCKLFAPLWWNIHDRLKELSTLAMVDKRQKLYIPSAWLRTDVPEALNFVELQSRLKSVPLWHGEMGDRLPTEKLQEVVDKIFEQVEAPVPLFDLTDTVLQVFRAKPDDTIPLEQPATDGEGKETGGTKLVYEPASEDEPIWIEVSVEEWLRSRLGSLGIDYLLVLKFYVCFGKPSYERTATCVRKVLGIQRFSRATAENRFNEVEYLLKTTEKPWRDIRVATGRYGVPYSPANEEEANAYIELFCKIVEQRLADCRYSREFLCEIGASVEEANV